MKFSIDQRAARVGIKAEGQSFDSWLTFDVG
jgi:hypothetical protein